MYRRPILVPARLTASAYDTCTWLYSAVHLGLVLSAVFFLQMQWFNTICQQVPPGLKGTRQTHDKHTHVPEFRSLSHAPFGRLKTVHCSGNAPSRIIGFRPNFGTGIDHSESRGAWIWQCQIRRSSLGYGSFGNEN